MERRLERDFRHLTSGLAVLAVLATLESASGGEVEPRADLEPGVPIQAAIEPGDPPIETERLARFDAPGARTRGKRYRLTVPEDGRYRIDLVSHWFKPYLVLRDAAGDVLHEDDYGNIAHPRLVVDLRANRSYMVDAASRGGLPGPFTLEVARLQHGAAPVTDRARLIERAREGLRIVEASGEESPALGIALHRLAFLLWVSGNTREARPLFERAVELREHILGDHFDTAESLDSLAQIAAAEGRDEAAELFDRAARMVLAVGGPHHAQTAETLAVRAVYLANHGRLAEAETVWARACVAARNGYGARSDRYFDCLAEHGQVLQRLGRVREAARRYDELLSMARRSGRRNSTILGACVLRGILAVDLEDLPRARHCFEDAMEMAGKLLRPDHSYFLSIRHNLAAVQHRLGLYDEAEVHYRRALEGYERSDPQGKRAATIHHNLGRLFADTGRFEEAREHFERALAIRERVLGERSPVTAQTHDNLGRALRLAGAPREALPHLECGLAIRREVLGEEAIWTAHSQHNLALARLDLREHDAARSLLEKARSIRTEKLGADHPDTLRTVHELARLATDTQDVERAWSLALETTRAADARLGAMLLSFGEAERLARAAQFVSGFELLMSLGSLRDDPSTEAILYDTLLRWKGRVSRSLLLSRRQLFGSLGSEARELHDRLQSVKRELSEALFLQDKGERAERAARTGALLDQRRKLENELMEMAGRGIAAADPAGASIRFGDVAAALPPKSAVIDLYRHRRYVPASPESPGRWSAPVLTVWVFACGASAPARVELGTAGEIERATRAFLEALVPSLRGVSAADDLAAAGTPRGARALNDRLRSLLWDPLAPHLAGSKTVFVSTDSFLGTLPLEVIQDADDRFLLEKHGFVYLRDMVSLVGIAASEPPSAGSSKRGLLAIGAIDYWSRPETRTVDAGNREPESPETGGAPSNGAGTADVEAAVVARGEPAPPGLRSFDKSWRLLSQTRDEVETLYQIHRARLGEREPRTLLVGTQATEEAVTASLPQHRVIHLATHGFFVPEGLPSMWEEVREAGGFREQMAEGPRRATGLMPGLLSGLVLAGANLPPEPGQRDGYLTAEEISLLDLSGVDLFVLSACETGVGTPKGGEGMLGLRRTIRQAGARTVISSLWKVDDASTNELMQSFYRNRWLHGKGTLDALREAKVRLLRTNRRKHDGDGRPFTWGAFVLDGDWR